MSKGNRGQGHNQPAPNADSARVAPVVPVVPREEAPVVVASTVDSSGTVPPFVEPFEPPLPIPPPERTEQAAVAAAEKVVREEVGAVAVDPNAAPGAVDAAESGHRSVESSLDAIEASLDSIGESVRNADDELRAGESEDAERKPECSKCTNERPCSVECFVAAGYPAEQYEQMFGEFKGAPLPADGVERPVHIDPTRNGKPLPDGAVMVRALRGVEVRVQHRNPGDRFWLFKSRPEGDANLLSQYADEFAERGDVELL